MTFFLCGCKVYVKFSFTVLVVIILLFLQSEYTNWSLLAIALHEFGHVIAMLKFRQKLCAITLNFYGIDFNYEKNKVLTENQELMISASGPIANIIMSIFFAIVYLITSSEILLIAAACQISICIFNLLPINQLDGGQIIYILLKKKFALERADKICFWISVIFIFLIGTVMLVTSLKFTFNYSLLVILIYLSVQILNYYYLKE